MTDGTTHYTRPDVAAFLAFLNAQEGPKMEELPAAGAREMFRAMTQMADSPRGDIAKVEDRVIPGPAGEIRVRIYDNRPDRAPGPVLVFFHGGGWVIGDLDTHDAYCAEAARILDRDVDTPFCLGRRPSAIFKEVEYEMVDRATVREAAILVEFKGIVYLVGGVFPIAIRERAVVPHHYAFGVFRKRIAEEFARAFSPKAHRLRLRVLASPGCVPDDRAGDQQAVVGRAIEMLVWEVIVGVRAPPLACAVRDEVELRIHEIKAIGIQELHAAEALETSRSSWIR